jgi:hypothetical protein
VKYSTARLHLQIETKYNGSYNIATNKDYGIYKTDYREGTDTDMIFESFGRWAYAVYAVRIPLPIKTDFSPYPAHDCTVTATCTDSAINLHRLYSLEGIPKRL